MIRMNVSGAAELIAALHNMRDGYHGTLETAMKISLRDVQEYARAHHRFITRTGEAERSIERSGIRHIPGGIEGEVGTTRRITIYLHQGTRPHVIVPRNKLALRWVSGGKFVFSQRVHHPGTRPDEFIFQAAEQLRPAIESRFDAAIRELIGGQ